MVRKFTGASRAASAVVIAFSLVACSNSNSDSESALFEVFHASQDAPSVTVSGSGTQLGGELTYGDVLVTTVAPGSVSLTVDGILPTGPATVIGPADVEAVDGQRVTVLAVNEVATIEPIVLIDERPEVSFADVRVRVVHAASTAPMVDVYVQAPDVDITTVAALGTFSFRDVLGPVEVPAADYRIQVTVAGDPTAVVYDSGTLALAGGSDLVLAAIANTSTGSAAIELVGSDGTESLRLLDANTPAQLRVVHASPDAPNVDVIANDNFASPAVNDLSYPDFTDYLELEPASLNVKVVPTGATEPVVIDADVELEAASSYTVLAANALASIEPLVLVDTLRRITTEAQVRIVHGSPSAGDVDIYVVASGTDISGETPAFSAVPFKADTGYVSLAAGDYDVVVTPTGSTDAAIGPLTITVEGGGIYTAIARDEVGLGVPLGLILLDDF